MTLSVMAATGARQHHAEIYTHWRYAIDISTFMPWTREHTYSLGTEIKETKQNVNKKKRNKIYNNRIYRLNNGVRCIYNSEQSTFVLSPIREACPSVQASLETYTNENLWNQVPYNSSSATPLTICTTASLKPLKGP